jgi:tripartite-type tricarboxylate transporter receptor subunit TctC
MLLLVDPALPVKSIGGFIAYAKANPGKLGYGTPGVGTPHQLLGEMLKKVAGIDLVHVPYRGTAPSLNGLLAHQVPAIIATTIAVMPFIESGKVRALATAGEERSSILPDVPTLAESGFPQINVASWFGLSAPAGTPTAIIERLNRDLRVVAETAGLRQRLAAQGFTIAVSSSDDFKRAIAARYEKYGRMVADIGLKSE